MKKHKRKTAESSRENVVKTCLDCDHCIYLGEGDHLCDLVDKFITEDWEPTEMFYNCMGKEFVDR